jgi:hypothetical protein
MKEFCVVILIACAGLMAAIETAKQRANRRAMMSTRSHDLRKMS